MTAGAIKVPTIFPLRPLLSCKSKNTASIINTSTAIEITCATAGSIVYYTTNGTKPDPFLTFRSAQKDTKKYVEPITLKAGKQIVKAIALSSDGQHESNIVSKTFEVLHDDNKSKEPITDNDSNFQDDLTGIRLINPHNYTKDLAISSTKDDNTRPHSSPKQRSYYEKIDVAENNVYSIKPTVGSIKGITTSESCIWDTYDHGKIPDDMHQVMRFQKETDFMKCPFCLSPRPADPYARFCNVCGKSVPSIPQTCIVPPVSGQNQLCKYCKSLVPFSLPTCIVCENPIISQSVIPKANIKIHEKLNCVICGTQNPANVNSCMTCEAQQFTNSGPISSIVSSPPVLHTDERIHMVYCSKCTRANDPNARYCDWCGAKPKTPASNLTCQECSAINQPYSRFCGSCSSILEPPNRGIQNIDFNVHTAGGKKLEPQWQPLSMPMAHGNRGPTHTSSTQTVGLNYPSERELLKKQAELDEKHSFEKIQKDRRPLLTSVSPGRGYWRKQLDHICAHLRAHTQNDSDFRSLIGEPRMGKLVSATIQEDGYELCLSVNFSCKKTSHTGQSLNLGQGDFLSVVTDKNDRSPTDTSRSEVSSLGSEKKKSHRKKKPSKKSNKESNLKLSENETSFFIEISKNGQGRSSAIQRLIHEGVNPNCLNEDGYSPIFIAVMNKQAEAIPTLIQNGAALNKKCNGKGNTPLHEAVLLGDCANDVVDILLGCGAKQNIKNDKGDTAYDLAVKNKFESVVESLTSKKAQSQLEKMMKAIPHTPADLKI